MIDALAAAPLDRRTMLAGSAALTATALSPFAGWAA
ncbi:hypothetical protein SAMN05444370_1664, partial [Rubrimonas cliftonensis]